MYGSLDHFEALCEPAGSRAVRNGLSSVCRHSCSSSVTGSPSSAGRDHFTVDGDDFYIDLLFYNWAQSRFVVVELKIGRFEPEHAGKLGFYVAWV